MARPRVREKVLAAAHELWQTAGASALTTRAVAKQAGVTEASVFNNFGNKAGLLRALIHEATPEYQALLAQLKTEPEGDLCPWLAAVFLAARNFFQAVLPLTGPLLALPLASKRLEDGKLSSENFYSGHRPLTQRLRELREAGRLSSEHDAGSTALLLMGAAMHTALTELTLGDTALETADETALAARVVAALGIAS